MKLPIYIDKKAPLLFENLEEWITKRELSLKLRFSISYINKLMRNKWIPYKKINRSVRFKYSEVIASLEKRSAT